MCDVICRAKKPNNNNNTNRSKILISQKYHWKHIYEDIRVRVKTHNFG